MNWEIMFVKTASINWNTNQLCKIICFQQEDIVIMISWSFILDVDQKCSIT